MGRLLSSYSHLSNAPARILTNARIPLPARPQSLPSLPGVSYYHESASPFFTTRHPAVVRGGRSSITFPASEARPDSSTSRFSILRHPRLPQGAYFRGKTDIRSQCRWYSDNQPKSPNEPRPQSKNPNEHHDSSHRTHGSSAGNTGETGKDGLPEGGDSESIASSVSKYFHDRLPRIPHRPTKEELLAAATNFRQRLKVRFKWMSIRSMRPWNIDEWGAFVSWFMLGHLVWILVGTTTFFSLVILSINTVFAQGWFPSAIRP